MTSVPFAFLLIAWAVQLTAAKRLAPAIITDPTVCLSDVECPPSYFCDDKGRRPSFTCQLVATAYNQSCSDAACPSALYCDQRTSRCRFKVDFGTDECCDSATPSSCVGYPDNVCSVETSRCVRNTGGLVDAPCKKNAECRQDKGLYCERKTRKCTRQVPVGGTCELFLNDRQCDGICIGESLQPFMGTCIALSSIGQPCTKHAHCHGQHLDPSITCNIPSGAIGKCFHVQSLLKTVGAKCNRGSDLCDARRGLACKWMGKDLGSVCVQHSVPADYGNSGHCTPPYLLSDKRLSSCMPLKGVPTECRAQGIAYGTKPEPEVDATPTPMTPSRVFPKCRRKREFMKRGQLCNGGDHIRCEKGLVCRRSPANLYSYREERTAHFCVKPAKKGDRCADKFRTVCDPGLTCHKGLCVDEDSVSIWDQEDWTHVQFDNGCQHWPCAPGLTCQTKKDLLVCDLPSKKRKEGETCYNSAMIKMICEDKLVCNVEFDGTGILKCRKRFGENGACKFNNQCKGKLKCEEFGRKCYEPDKAIYVSERCEPNGEKTTKSCSPPWDTGPLEYKCLPRKNGQFYCHYEADLFQFCKKADYCVCRNGTRRTKANFCHFLQ